MRISHKYALALAALVVALLLTATVTIVGLLSLERSTRAVDEEFGEFTEVIAAKQAFSPVGDRPLDLVLSERENTQRGIADALEIVEELEAEQSGVSEFDKHHMEAEVESAREVESHLRAMRDELAAAGDNPLDAAARARFDESRRSAHAGLDRMADEIREAAETVRDSSDNFKRRARNLIIVICVAVALGAIAFTLWMYHRISRPLVQLRGAVQTMSSGQDYPEIHLRGHDELTELADEFNEMSARLREYYRTLEQRVAEKSRQLVRSERLASTGFLAAGVAHEINNPLAAISGHAESLLRRLDELDGDGRPVEQGYAVFKRYLQTIRDEAFRCKEITRRLLDFSRLGEGSRPAPGGVDLCDVIHQTVNLVAHVDRYRNRQVILHEPPQPLDRVCGTAEEIKQVMMNLLVNALDAVSDGGRVEICCRSEADRVAVEVSDDGRGMDAATLDKAFEPFFSMRGEGRGTGLGLSISLAIVEAFGGELSAASDGPGQGATFTMTLPRAEQPAAEPYARR